MLRRKIAAFLSTLVLSTSALGAPPSKETPPAPAALAEHLKRAERARNEKRWTDAIAAYRAALDWAQRQKFTEAETAGILLELGLRELAAAQYTDAARYLFRATVHEDTLNDEQRGGAVMDSKRHSRKSPRWSSPSTPGMPRLL